MSQRGDHTRSLRSSQYLLVGCAALRSEDTEPHLVHLRHVRPEAKEFVEVSGALRDLRRDGAVNGDSRTLNVLEDALIGSGFAAFVMFGLQAINGDHDVQFLELHPCSWNLPECAGDDLGVYAAALDLWQERVEFAVSNERIAAHQRDMERPMLVDHSEHSHNQFVALEVRELAKLCRASQVCRIECVASRTAQGAFLGDLDRKRRCAAGEDAGPCA